MSRPQFEYTLPITKRKVVWSPLRVADEMDAQATCKGSREHLYGYELLALRIVSLEGADGHKGAFNNTHLREWDAQECEMFLDHVREVEAARRAALAPSSASPLPASST